MKSNLVIRTLTGVVFVLLLVGCIVFGPQTYALLFAVITGMTTWEFCTIVNKNANLQVNRLITTVAAVYFFFAVLGFNLNVMDAGIFVPYILTLLYLLISELYFDRENSIQNWAFSFMAQLYVALPFALLNTLSFIQVPGGEYGTPMLTYTWIFSLSIFVFLWSNDTGAYCFGSMLGRHRLFPRISPKKSWEGSIGGALVAVAASQIIASFSSDFNAQSEVINRFSWGGLALVVVVFGTWGDLVESLLKRKLGIKDSGKILPGHGGMLDRFDSSLLAIPASVIYIYTLNSGAFHHMFESILK